MLQEVGVQGASIRRLAPVVGQKRVEQLENLARLAQEVLSGRTVFNVNSTANGGGVAEMMQVLLAYARGADIDARWAVIRGTPDFFAITKRIHNGLHGSVGDGGPLGKAERECYEGVLAENAEELKAVVRPGDVVILHDPQTAGLVEHMGQAGAVVVWRCHVGSDSPNAMTSHTWDFLRPYLEEANAYVFSRAAYVPPWMDHTRSYIIQPSIDPYSAKNVLISPADADAILRRAGLIQSDGDGPAAAFRRSDGSLGQIGRIADLMQTGPPPPAGVPLVVQVSRWDRLKDMPGVMVGFADHLNGPEEAHLMLVGPAVSGVADDPEGGQVLDECFERWRELPHPMRDRVHMACLPMADRDENAAMVNAIQRHAAVVVQKSIAEGFGLTVTEAMWKRRPIVASAVGGISDQIVDGEHGLLLQDPQDLEGLGRVVGRLLEDRPYAERLGDNAHRRVVGEFLDDRHLEQYVRMFQQIVHAPAAS